MYVDMDSTKGEVWGVCVECNNRSNPEVYRLFQPWRLFNFASARIEPTLLLLATELQYAKLNLPNKMYHYCRKTATERERQVTWGLTISVCYILPRTSVLSSSHTHICTDFNLLTDEFIKVYSQYTRMRVCMYVYCYSSDVTGLFSFFAAGACRNIIT